MTREEFLEAVRRRVDEAAADALQQGEAIPFVFDSDRVVWQRGALTVSVSFETGRAISIASRVPTALLGAGNNLSLPADISEDGAARIAQAVVMALGNPYLYN